MFRLTFFLCAGIFLALLIGGADRGQKRFGLMEAAAPVREATVVAPEAAPTAAAAGTAAAVEAQVAAAAPRTATPPVGVAQMPLVSPVSFEPESGAEVFSLADPGPALIDLVPDEAAAASLSGPPAGEAAPGWAVVVARSVNVRSGPSTGDSITGRLVRGDEVMVVEASADVDGWARVRVEGDGIEGFVATRFLAPQAQP